MALPIFEVFVLISTVPNLSLSPSFLIYLLCVRQTWKTQLIPKMFLWGVNLLYFENIVLLICMVSYFGVIREELSLGGEGGGPAKIVRARMSGGGCSYVSVRMP